MITEWVKEVARTPGAREAHAQHHRHPRGRARRQAAAAPTRSPPSTPSTPSPASISTRSRRGPTSAGSPRTAATAGRRSSRSRSTWCSRSRRDPEVGLPISGIGGISGWRDAAEFILLGCGTVQVCTAAMHYGFRIVEDMIDGLSNWMDEKGFRTIEDFRGLSLSPRSPSGSTST